MDTIEHKVTAGQIPLGEQLADKIQTGLKDRLLFADRDGELAILQDQLPALAELTISETDCYAEAQQQITALIQQGAEQRLARHQHMLSINQVLLPGDTNDDQYNWEPIRESDQPLFLDAAGSDKTVVEQVTEKASRQHINGNQVAEEALAVILEEASGLLQEAKAIIPNPNHVYMPGKLGKFMYKLFGGEPSTEVYDATNDTINDIERTRISRKVRKLNDLLDGLTGDPTAVLVEKLLQGHEDELALVGAGWLDELIADQNAQSLPQVIGRQKRETEYEPNTFTDKSEDLLISSWFATASPEAGVADATLQIEDCGEYAVCLPWLHREEPRELLQKYTFGDKSVLVMSAIENRRLKNASEGSRFREPIGKDEQSIYDSMLEHQAKSVAEGVMPYQQRTSAKKLKRIDRSEFERIPIWYAYDITPNAHRVYFTLSKLGDILSSHEKRRPSLDLDARVVILLAETDKVAQLDTLQVLTGSSRKTLRQHGAGAK